MFFFVISVIIIYDAVIMTFFIKSVCPEPMVSYISIYLQREDVSAKTEPG